VVTEYRTLRDNQSYKWLAVSCSVLDLRSSSNYRTFGLLVLFVVSMIIISIGL
jgi:hypothetical protein